MFEKPFLFQPPISCLLPNPTRPKDKSSRSKRNFVACCVLPKWLFLGISGIANRSPSGSSAPSITEDVCLLFGTVLLLFKHFSMMLKLHNHSSTDSIQNVGEVP